MQLKDILAAHRDDVADNIISGKFNRNPEGLEEVQAFLNDHGFDNLEYLGSGSGSLVLSDAKNPNLVIRIAPDNMIFERAAIPQVLQAIFVKKDFEEISGIKLEILPRLKSLESISEEEFQQRSHNFTTESGNRLPQDFFWPDFGVYEYQERGIQKYVLMAADDSVFHSEYENKCAAGYPPLAIQQAQHQDLWNQDKRLQTLLPEGPTPLPQTRITPDTRRADQALG